MMINRIMGYFKSVVPEDIQNKFELASYLNNLINKLNEVVNSTNGVIAAQQINANDIRVAQRIVTEIEQLKADTTVMEQGFSNINGAIAQFEASVNTNMTEFEASVLAENEAFKSDVETTVNTFDGRVSTLEDDLVNELGKKADKVQENWITPTLLNGATTIGGVPVKYKKDQFGRVFMEGWVNLSVVSFKTPFIILPQVYRPLSPKRYSVAGSGVTGIMRINANGELFLEIGSAANIESIALDSINFSVV